MNKNDMIIDTKVTKIVYPTQNNSDTLQFTFEQDPNLALVKNNLKIHFEVELPEQYIAEQAFCAKQFGSLSVELNSQRVSYSKSRCVISC